MLSVGSYILFYKPLLPLYKRKIDRLGCQQKQMALILANWRKASHRYYLKLVSRVEGMTRGYAGPWLYHRDLGGVKLGKVSGT